MGANGYLPIWDTLVTFYQVACSKNGAASDDCKHVQRAYNLQAAYQGWLAVGCPRKETRNGHVYQTMAVTDPSATFKSYQCEAAKTGCYSNDDCHLGGAGSVCYCYGETCIDTYETIPGTNEKRDVVRGSKSDHYNSGVNNACYYHFIAHCDCNYDWAGGFPKRNLWVQGQSVSSLPNSNLS